MTNDIVVVTWSYMKSYTNFHP